MWRSALWRLALAALVAGVTACVRMLTRTDPSQASPYEACAGLSGQPKLDCERRQTR